MNTIKTLSKSIREYKKPSILTPVFITFEVIIECFIPFIMAKLINTLQAYDMSIKLVLVFGGILVLMGILSLIAGTCSGRFAATASCGFAKNLRKDLFYRVQDFSFSDIDKFSSASLVTRLTTDITRVQNAYQMLIRIAVRTPLMFLFSIIMSFSISSKLAWVFVAAIPVVVPVLLILMRFVLPTFRRIFKKYDNMNNSVEENVSGIRVVKSFVREDFEKKKFGKISEDVCRDFVFAERLLGLAMPFMNLILYTVILIISYLSAKIIISTGATELSTGDMSSLIVYGIQVLSSIIMLCAVFVMLTMAAESAKRIAEVIDHKPTLTGVEDDEIKVASGDIEFDHVSFKYSEKDHQYALSDINLSIKSGETIGIIGSTGSSKTTLIQLIPRLYDATEGKVLVAGHDVKEYNLDVLRNAVSVVLQKNVLFSGTIRENLCWGNENASDDEIIHACKAAQAYEFISSFEEGLDTKLDQGGTNVSGGQKQRLCIARALLKKPQILILDDSTSAVDTKTDALIRAALKKEMPHVTKLIIAQRIASVQDADRILVLENGKIAEQGTHSELLSHNGIYSEIYYSQTKVKEDEE